MSLTAPSKSFAIHYHLVIHICFNIIDIKSFRSHYGSGVDSASKKNEYQEYFLG